MDDVDQQLWNTTLDEYENEFNDGQTSSIGEESSLGGDNTTQLEQQMHNVECPKAIVDLATKPSSSKPACDANGTTFAIGTTHASKIYLTRKLNNVMMHSYGMKCMGSTTLGLVIWVTLAQE